MLSKVICKVSSSTPLQRHPDPKPLPQVLQPAQAPAQKLSVANAPRTAQNWSVVSAVDSREAPKGPRQLKQSVKSLFFSDIFSWQPEVGEFLDAEAVCRALEAQREPNNAPFRTAHLVHVRMIPYVWIPI